MEEKTEQTELGKNPQLITPNTRLKEASHGKTVTSIYQYG